MDAKLRPLAPETACLHAEGEAPCSEVNWMNEGSMIGF
jgi:hypothetical protein